MDHRSQLLDRADCRYNLQDHSIGAVRCLGLTFNFIDPTLSSPTPRLGALLGSSGPRCFNNRFTTFRYSPWLPDGDGSARDRTSLAQLLQLIHLPTHLIPPALLNRVHFTSVSATLIDPTAADMACCVAGTATCCTRKAHQLLFFNRLGSASIAVPVAHEPSGRKRDAILGKVVHSPITRWLRLQCGAVLDSAVFPQLATLTVGRCLEPLYEYELFETAGGVEVNEEQCDRFADGFRRTTANYTRHRALQLPRARPTNAVVALSLTCHRAILSCHPHQSLERSLPPTQQRPRRQRRHQHRVTYPTCSSR